MSKFKIEFTGDWAKAQKQFATAGADLDKALRQGIRQEAEYLVGQVKKQFDHLSPPLSPLTLATKRRGGSKPLIASGELRTGIAVVMGGPYEAFIGVPRSSRGMKLADIHENGRIVVQRMTDKQRKFLHARLPKGGGKGGKGGGGGGILVIHIPARPFIKPVFAAEKDKIGPRLLDRIAERVAVLGGTK